MARKSKRERIESMHEINVTPIIDVSLTLVVILLLMTPLVFESSIGIRKALASARASAKEEKQERVELGVVSEDSIFVNRRLVCRADLAGVLGPLLQDKVEKRVVIECADRVSHGAFVNVLDQAKLCGASEIAVQGR